MQPNCSRDICARRMSRSRWTATGRSSSWAKSALPGNIPMSPGMTVQKAIAAAGGFSARAYQDNADITRAINGKVMTGRVLISDPILPGDTIYVRERLF